MIYECELTEDDIKGNYLHSKDCPLFRTMKKSKIPILNVGGHFFYTLDFVKHEFTTRIKQLDIGLAGNNKTNLVGERFTVEL